MPPINPWPPTRTERTSCPIAATLPFAACSPTGTDAGDGFQISVYSPNRKSATDAVVPFLTNSLASSSHRSFQLDDSHSSMAKPVADRMEGFRAKGDLVGNINLKVCRAVD